MRCSLPVALCLTLLAGCATPLPTATPEALRAATGEVVVASVRLEAIVQACAALGGDLPDRAALADGTWRARHRRLLLNADAQYRASLVPQAGPWTQEKTLLPAVRLRRDAQREADAVVRGPARNRDVAAQIAACLFELSQYEDGTRDLRVLPSMPGLVVLDLPSPTDAGGDLAVPTVGAGLQERLGIGTSLSQVEKLLAGKRCRNPVILRLEETGVNETYVAGCEGGRHYVARCAFRNCTFE